ncbi:MAG: small ligand-binding sensory domain FIST, partial [Gammaproteobacteria bacterium]
ANKPTSGGLSGVLMSPQVQVTTRLSQGCSPIGARHEVTQCERNVIIELDGRPALEVFKEDIGEILARDLSRAAGYIFVGLPITGSDTGDYLVRNLVGVDPRAGVVAIGEVVEPGQKVMFCRRDGPSAVRDMQRMLEEIDSATSGPPAAGVYYSCLARGPNLFGPNSEEVGMIAQALGDFPLIGFFANGEISHNRLYAYTGVLTLFTGG